MSKQATASIFSHFEKVTDPRINRKKKHKLLDIFFMTLTAVICGANNWVMIEEFCKSKQDWLESILDLENGIPSHDTFGRVFAALNTAEFIECFNQWMKDVAKLTNTEVIAIDGKCLNGTKTGLTMLNAWASENDCVVAQEVVDSKSNEITAMPALLSKLDLVGNIVTTDAMGTQKKTAKQIIQQGGDYVLCLKGNQSTLHEDVGLWFSSNLQNKLPSYESLDCDHGRIEHRSTFATSDIDWLKERHDWQGLQTIVAVNSIRQIKANGKKSSETRYFISSIHADEVEKIAKAIRSHWSIENKLHWSLDVSFDEDKNRTRVENSAANLSVIRQIALNLLKKEKSSKVGIETKRMKAGWDNKYLLKIIGNF